MRNLANRAIIALQHRSPGMALRQFGLACALFGVLFGALFATSCVPTGTRVAGVDSLDLRRLAERDGGEVWLALPMRKWLGTRENIGRPEALIACIAPTCRNRLIVGVFRLEGETADRAERDLRDPQMLMRGLAARANDRKSGDGSASAANRMAIDISAYTLDDLSGFTISLTPPQNEAVHGAAIGRRERDGLRIILAVGDDMQVVRAALGQVHAETF